MYVQGGKVTFVYIASLDEDGDDPETGTLTPCHRNEQILPLVCTFEVHQKACLPALLILSTNYSVLAMLQDLTHVTDHWRTHSAGI